MTDHISELENLKKENEQLRIKLNENSPFPLNLTLFEKALNKITDSVFIVGTDRTILFTNESFDKIYGYENDSIVGKHGSVVYGEKTGRERFDEIFKDIMTTGWEGEVFHKKKNGEEFPVWLTASVIEDVNEGKDAIFGITKDLTEEVEKEKSFKAAKDRYENLFHELKNVVYESSPHGRLLDINPAGVKLFGFESKEELMNVDIANDLYVDPKDREVLKTEIEKKGYIKIKRASILLFLKLLQR